MSLFPPYSIVNPELSLATTPQEEYAKSLRHALDHIYVVATRRGLDTRKLVAEIDPDRDPGIHLEHTLVISVRDTRFLVRTEGIPHEWIAVGTGFIDTRFSHRIAIMLSELEKKCVEL